MTVHGQMTNILPYRTESSDKELVDGGTRLDEWKVLSCAWLVSAVV